MTHICHEESLRSAGRFRGFFRRSQRILGLFPFRHVAEKDREISELKQRLTSQEELAAQQSLSSEAVEISEAIDEDTVIQQQRERLAQLEEEWQEKLRTAEMELSLERAKIARETSQLNESRIELESLQESLHYPRER